MTVVIVGMVAGCSVKDRVVTVESTPSGTRITMKVVQKPAPPAAGPAAAAAPAAPAKTNAYMVTVEPL